MRSNYRGKWQASRLQALLATGVVAVGLCLAATTANADPISISSVVGGVPSGNNYENFDALALGDTGGPTGSGITVNFGNDGQAVQGSVSGQYAAPYLSNNNGTLFGNPNDGQNATTYLTTGVGSVTLLFPALEQYMGLLWGSVDLYNTLSFYNGATLIGTITGGDVNASANGDQGAQGTYYVNINSILGFDRVVATSSSYAFEFDNVAFNERRVGVPEPGIAGLFMLGLLLLGSGYWLQQRSPG